MREDEADEEEPGVSDEARLGAAWLRRKQSIENCTVCRIEMSGARLNEKGFRAIGAALAEGEEADSEITQSKNPKASDGFRFSSPRAPVPPSIKMPSTPQPTSLKANGFREHPASVRM